MWMDRDRGTNLLDHTPQPWKASMGTNSFKYLWMVLSIFRCCNQLILQHVLPRVNRIFIRQSQNPVAFRKKNSRCFITNLESSSLKIVSKELLNFVIALVVTFVMMQLVVRIWACTWYRNCFCWEAIYVVWRANLIFAKGNFKTALIICSFRR